MGDGHSASSRIFGAKDDLTEIAGYIESAGYRVRLEPEKTAYVVRIDEKLANICPRGHNKDQKGWMNAGCAECARIRSKNYNRGKLGIAPQEMEPIVMTLPRMLGELDLLGNKHIPVEYLRASYEQRLSLVQGLMDTDGHIAKNGRCEFVTTSKPIADGFDELLFSLGIKHRVSEKIPSTIYKNQRVYGKKAYRFSFMVYEDKPVFKLTRKLNKIPSRDGRRATEVERRRIISIEKTNSVPVRCILVDNDEHLFLAGKAMIPTHNTEILNNAVGYFISQDPSPMLVVQPTLDMAQTWSKDRLAPMLRDTPVLGGLVKDPRSRDSGNTTLHKVFPGGHVTACGANSPSSLASRPVRNVFCDEVDRYPVSAGTEGDPVSLAKKRSATFWNRKILLVSTPTNKGASRIENAYEESDQRKYHVPCPHCHFEQPLVWSSVKWELDRPDTAQYCCSECGGLWDDAQRARAIKRGKWVTDLKTGKIAGFHLSALYSPWTPLEDGVRDFLEAKKQPATLKVKMSSVLVNGKMATTTGVKKKA